MYLITRRNQRSPCMGYFINKTIFRRIGCNGDTAENIPQSEIFY